jgi:hypothetical protein
MMVMHHLAIERSARTRDLDDDDDGPAYCRPITLPRLEWGSEAEFRLFARVWRIKKRPGLERCGTDTRRDLAPVLLSAPRKAVGICESVPAEKQTVVRRKVKGDSAGMAEEEAGEGPCDLVALFAEAEAEYSAPTQASQRRGQGKKSGDD